MSHARRPRAVFAALALSALALSSAPLASPAAAPPPHAAASAAPAKPATRTGESAKSAVKPVTRTTAAASAKTGASVKSAPGGKPGAKSAAAKAKPKPAPKPLFSYKDAPADEYFGRLKMSILGVRSKVKDLGLDADMHPEHDPAILSTALWVEDAMRDWSKKYPYDHWLPRYAYALEVMYERIPGDEAAKRARRQLNYITAFFPQTEYGKVGRAKLADGIPTPDPSAAPETELERLALIDGKVRPTIPPLAAAPVPTAVPGRDAGPASAVAPGPATSTFPIPTNGPSLTEPAAPTAPTLLAPPATELPAPAATPPFAPPGATSVPAPSVTSAPAPSTAPAPATTMPAPATTAAPAPTSTTRPRTR